MTELFQEPMLDRALRNQGRDDDGRSAWPQLIELEAVLTTRRAGRRGSTRCDMVIEAAVFVVRDDQHAGFPMRGIADCLVRRLDEPFACGDAAIRVLRISSPEISRVEQAAEVIWLYVDESRIEIPALKVFREFLEFAHVERVTYAIELTDDRKVVPARGDCLSDKSLARSAPAAAQITAIGRSAWSAREQKTREQS